MARPVPPRPNRRAIAVSIAIAVGVHVAVLVWMGTRSAGRLSPPAIEGAGLGAAPVGGLPASSRRAIHDFRVVDADSEDAPILRARVTDVLRGEEVLTDSSGRARLAVRPAAMFLLRVDRPGFATHTEQVANADGNAASHTIHLRRAPVPWALVDTIFIQRCIYCHGGTGRTVGIDLTTYTRVIASTSRTEPILVPGNPDASILVHVLTDTARVNGKLPYHARATQRVPQFDVDVIAQWVREGARGPEPPRPR